MSNLNENIGLAKKPVVDEVSDELEKELKEAFDLFDEDGSGTISKDEFANVMVFLSV